MSTLFWIICVLYLLVGWTTQPIHFLIVLFLAIFTDSQYARDCFLGYDQLLNVKLKHIFNKMFNPVYTFGNPDETISSVMGKNIRDYPSRSRAFKRIDKVLTKIDKQAKHSHCIEAIEHHV